MSSWRVRIDQVQLESLRGDAAFAEVLTLGRISNLLRGTWTSGQQFATGDDIVSHRQRMAMLFILGALVAEAFLTLERLGMQFRHLAAYSDHIQPLLRDPKISQLRKDLLSELRNRSVFHNDQEVSQLGLQHLALPEGANIAEGPNASFTDVYFSLGDLVALSYLVNSAGVPADPMPWIRTNFIAVHELAFRICTAIDYLVGEELARRGMILVEDS